MKTNALPSRLAAGLFAVLLTLSASAADTLKWDKFVHDYLDGYFALNPSSAVYQGRHEYDGQLPTGAKRIAEKDRVAQGAARRRRGVSGGLPRRAPEVRARLPRDAGARRPVLVDDGRRPAHESGWYGDTIDPTSTYRVRMRRSANA
ncbi:MAG: hypothetical protein WDM96_05640 [Lacunisphaera sp.]